MRGSITGNEGGGGKEGRSQRIRELAAYEGLLLSPSSPLPCRPFSAKKNPRRCAHLLDGRAYVRAPYL